MGVQQFPIPSSGIPSGQTANRPASPSIGTTFYNGTLGLLEIYTALGWVPASAPPGVITMGTVSAVSGSGRAFNNAAVSIPFTTPTDAGLPTTYIVTSTPGSFTATGTSSPITFSSLAGGTAYTFTVSGRNAYGNSVSASSASNSVTPTTLPEAPTIGTAVVPAVTQAVDVAFTGNGTGGSAVTSYTVTSSPGALTASGASSPIRITGLTNGTAYTFTVTANNANGASIASSASNSVTPIAPFVATGGNEVKTVGSFKYHIFTTSSTFAVSAGGSAQILVVGGGGGGGGNRGGGGGAGAIEGSSYWQTQTLTAGNYNVTVGANGTGGVNAASGTNGGNSVFAGASTITALGGGSGGSQAGSGAAGGSGGGGGFAGGAAGSGGAASGSNTNAGGPGTQGRRSGGGGGAAGGGSDGWGGSTGGAARLMTVIDSNFTSANFTSFSGMTTFSAGGGGGGDGANPSGGTAGTGGGNGGGGSGNGANAVSYGSGGGGGGDYQLPPYGSGNGGSGKSGIVIVRYNG